MISLAWFFNASLLVVVLFRSLVAIASSVQDVADARLRRCLTLAKKPKTRPNKQVQFVVISKDNQDTVIHTLKSIIATRPSLPVIIVDNGSKDNTLRIVKDFVKNNPSKTTFKITSKRLAIINADLVKATSKKCKGTILVVCDGTMSVPRSIQKQVVTKLTNSPTVNVLSFGLKAGNSLHLFGVLQTMQSNLDHMSRKALQLIGKRPNPLQRLGYAYRKPLKNRQSLVALPSTIVVNYTPAQSVKQYLSYNYNRSITRAWYLHALAITELAVQLFITTYAVVLAISFTSSMLVLLLAVIASFWLLLAIWSDPVMPLKRKALYSYFVPAELLLLPASAIALIASNVKQVIK